MPTPKPWDQDVTLPSQAAPRSAKPWDQDPTLEPGRTPSPGPEAYRDESGALVIPNVLRKPPPVAPISTGDRFYQDQEDYERAVRQGVNPHATSKNFGPLFGEAEKPELLGYLDQDIAGGKTYKRVNPETKKVEELGFNPEYDFIARDPETGRDAVWTKTDQAREGMLTRLGRAVSPWLLTGPVTTSVPGSLARVRAAREAELLAQQARTGAPPMPTSPPPIPQPAPQAYWPFQNPRPPLPANPLSSAPPPASVANAPVLNPPTFATPTGVQIANNRAEAAARDADAFDELGVRKPPVVFQTGLGSGLSHMVSRIPWLGSPIHQSVEEAVKGASGAVQEIAGQMAAGRGNTAEAAGSAVQQGLNRFRSTGVNKVEPEQLTDIGIQPRAPGAYVGEVLQYGPGMNVPGVAPRNGLAQVILRPDGRYRWYDPARHVIVADAGRTAAYANAGRYQALRSRGQIRRAAEAQPIREALGGGYAQTSRGVRVQAPGTMDQVIMGRRGAEDLSDAELHALMRTPAQNTSFAARGEALYENALRSVPRQFTAAGSRNWQALPSHNTAAALRTIQGQIANDIAGQGTITGQLAERLMNLRSNFSLPDLRAIRTEIGRRLGNFNPLTTSLDRTQLKMLYGAVTRDIEEGLRDIANRAYLATREPPVLGNRPNPTYLPPDVARRADQALRDFRMADRYWRQGMNRMDEFARVVGLDNPQAAAGVLERAAYEGTRGNMQLLRRAMGVLRPEERNQFASMVLGRMGRPKDSAAGIVKEANFSPTSFMTAWDRMNPEAKELLFGGEYARSVDNLVRVANRLRNYEALANTSRSGTDIINFVLMFGAPGYLTGKLAPFYGAGLAGMGGYSLLLSRPEYVNWLTKYAQLRAQIASATPSSATGGRALALYSQLYRMTLRDPSLAPVLKAIADEHGIDQGGQDDQQREQRKGVQ